MNPKAERVHPIPNKRPKKPEEVEIETSCGASGLQRPRSKRRHPLRDSLSPFRASLLPFVFFLFPLLWSLLALQAVALAAFRQKLPPLKPRFCYFYGLLCRGFSGARLSSSSSLFSGSVWGSMAMDPRHVLAGFLTISMFAMVGNMIKKDHFDTVEVSLQDISAVQVDVLKEEKSISQVARIGTVARKESNQELKPCWSKPGPKDVEQSRGYITFSLRSGPEYHVSQVADAVVIARYLSATLVIPDIRGSKHGQRRNFRDMYDADKFIQSLSGVVKVVSKLPAEVAAAQMATIIRVPNGVSEEFMVKHIEPVFLAKKYLRLASYFPSVDLRARERRNSDLDSTACLAMFGSLELKQEISEVAEKMVERLKTLSCNVDSRFIAIDLRTDALGKKSCKESEGRRKTCYNAQEIADFLRKLGFSGDNTIYITQSWWDQSLNSLKEFFLKTYTKDDLIPAEKKREFLDSGSELQRALDFHICSNSDVFVPATPGLFYGNVVGKRIPAGRTEILVPFEVPSFSAMALEFVSNYVSKKNHVAYSCYC